VNARNEVQPLAPDRPLSDLINAEQIDMLYRQSPTSIVDCLATTQWAVYLAEALQAPAIVLSDQFMGQSRAIVDRPAYAEWTARRLTAAANVPDYKRYRDTESGVSPMAIPGTPGVVYTADGLTHSEGGIPSSQSRDHRLQLDKRLRKLVDHDYGDARYAREDVREALTEAKASGITPFCITIDRESEAELRDLYGDVGYTIIDDVLSLPERMPNIYRRLTS